MRVHTNDFKEELKVFGRQIKGKIIYYPSYDLVSESDNNILTEADLQVISEQANYDEPIEISEEDIFSISVIKNGNLLQSLMKEFDFETKEELNIGSVVNPQFGLLVNGDYEYLNYGNYIINSKEFNMDTETWSYVCYDKMLFSMVKYSGLSNIEYPITIKQFINKLCDKIGLEFEDSEFVNQEQLIYEDLYKNMNVTYRDIFDEISKIVAGNLLINDNDKLKVGYVNKAVSESGEESGSSIEITDGEEAELSSFELEGNTTQATSTQGANLFDEEYYRNATYTNNVYRYTLSKIKGGRRLYVKAKLKEGKSAVSGIYVCLSTNPNPNTSGSQFQWFINNGNTHNGSFNPETFTDYLYFSFYPTTTLSQILDNYNLWVSTDNINYEPFIPDMPSPDYPSELVSVGYENLVPSNWANNFVSAINNSSRANIVTKDNKNALFYIPSAGYGDYNNANFTKGIVFETNTQYTIQFDILKTVTTNQTFAIYYTDGTYSLNAILTTTDNWEHQVLTSLPNKTISYIQPYYTSGNTYIDIDTFIITKGTQEHSYIPYGKYGIEVKATNNNNESKTYLYTLDNPLRSIGDTKDLLYIKNGKLYVDRKIGQLILSGSENWAKQNNWSLLGDNTNAYYFTRPSEIKQGTELLSNYFKYLYNNFNYDKISIFQSANIIIRTPKTISTVAELKTWLSTHNTEVQYVLAESYTEELGQVDMPSTYEGITYIDTTDELEPTMNVSYISEFEEIDEQYLKDTNVRMSEKIGVINSVAILDTDNNLEYIQEDTESIKANEMTRITITNNLLALNGDTNTIALNILNKLNGLYYYANDLQTTGVCYYDYLDLFNVEARGNTYQCLLLNNEITITQGIEEHIFTEKLEEAQTSSNEYTTSVMTNKQIQFNINQQEGRIESKVEKDGVISAINQSAEEIKINADKLSFEGATIDMTADNVKIQGENLRIEGDEIEITDDGTTYNPNFSINYKDNSNLYWIKSAISSTSIWFRGKDSQYASPGYLGDFRMTLPGSSSFVPGIKMYWSQTENDIYPNYPDESEYLNLRYTEIYPQSITLYYNNKTTTIKASGITTPTLTQTSKAESKKNFEKLTNAKDILNQVDIYKYNLKGEEDNVKKSIGFVIGDDFNYSQEITSENNDGANIYSMVSVLWQVVKEQQEEINELKEMIKNGKY